MKPYVFGIGVLLMLSFSLAGMALTAAGLLRRYQVRFAPMLSLMVAACLLVTTLAALAWSVPPRG